jgi:hypothetical protein
VHSTSLHAFCAERGVTEALLRIAEGSRRLVREAENARKDTIAMVVSVRNVKDVRERACLCLCYLLRKFVRFFGSF